MKVINWKTLCDNWDRASLAEQTLARAIGHMIITRPHPPGVLRVSQDIAWNAINKIRKAEMPDEALGYRSFNFKVP